MALRECAKVEKLLYKQARYFSGLLKGDWKFGTMIGNFLSLLKLLVPACSQRGNFNIFQSSRLYVKSILEIVDAQKLPFWQFQWRWILVFNEFLPFLRAEIYQNLTSRATKTAKMAYFSVFQKLISCKIAEKYWNSHTVMLWHTVSQTVLFS